MYIIYKSKNNEFYFVLTAKNGEVILTSQMYKTKQNCSIGIQSVKAHSPYDLYYYRGIAKNSEYYFTLKALNGQVIGVSQMYGTTQSREVGIKSVKENGPVSQVLDRSSQVA